MGWRIGEADGLGSLADASTAPTDVCSVESNRKTAENARKNVKNASNEVEDPKLTFRARNRIAKASRITQTRQQRWK